MKREEYNACMSPYMKGSKTREQRQRDMCIGAKLCTGKAKTKEEAEKICNVPKLPKWAKQALPQELVDSEMPCPEKINRIRENIDIISLKARNGEAEEVKSVAALVYHDMIQCRPDPEIIALVDSSMGLVADLSKRYYLKGESKELDSQLNLLREVIT